MYCYQFIFAVVIVVLSSEYKLFTAADPSPPMWPTAFQEQFNETSTIPIIGTGSNIKGVIYYDFDKKAYRIDRSTGKYDRYCSSIENFRDIPCNHLVVNGLRYLVYPSVNYCCMCCTAEDGCGMLKPDWLSDAKFIGYNTSTSVKYQVWDKKGLQDNFYWQVDGTLEPYIIDQQPNDLMVFDVSTFKKGPVDPAVFALPSFCSKDKKCPLISVCTVAR